MQQVVADLVGDREAAPLPGLVLADPDLLAGRQQHPGQRDALGRTRNRSEVVGDADAKAAEALAELLDVNRRWVQVVGGGEAVERLAGDRPLIHRRRR